MKYQRVWVSTIEHIKDFSTFIKKNKKTDNSAGALEMPKEFPFINSMGKKSPVSLLAKGELEILDSELVFKSKKYRIENLRIYNLIENLHIHLNYPELSITRFNNPDPYKKSTAIEWIKIDSEKEIEGFYKHILICRVPFYSSIYNIRNSTDSLYESLVKKLENF